MGARVTTAEALSIAPRPPLSDSYLANGSGTVTRGIRITDPGSDASVTAMLGDPSTPPRWLPSLLQTELPARDEHGLLKFDALIKFANACAALPIRTPKPFFTVGDDATISAEWDIGEVNVTIQVGNHADEDWLYVEDRGREIGEIPLTAQNVKVFLSIMRSILSRRPS
jgi:hypothetical protein